MPYKDPEKRKKYGDEYRKRPDVRKKIRERNKKRMRKLRANKEFRDVQNAKRRAIHHKNKFLVIHHYSNGTMQCECCGIDYIEFNTIDHPNGGGQAERRKIKRSPGRDFYAWLIREDFPPRYRIKCFNCNSAWGFLGYCPHAMERIRKFFEKNFSPL